MLRGMVERNPGSEPVLAHGSVYLRPGERDDIALFVRWFGDARTARNLGMRAPISLAGEERWFERMLEHHGKDEWFFVICRRADDRPLGSIGFFEVDGFNGSAGLGISIGDPADTAQGYGSDAMRALLAFGFGRLRLERIWLDVYEHNDAAKRLYERIGFVVEGRLRHAFWRDGHWVDSFRMAILADEWRATAADGPVA